MMYTRVLQERASKGVSNGIRREKGVNDTRAPTLAYLEAFVGMARKLPGSLRFLERRASEPDMDIKRSRSQPSGRGPQEYFTGTVRIDPLFQAPDRARVDEQHRGGSKKP